MPTPQRAKRKAVKRARLDADHVHYVEADFADPNWINALSASPYDPEKKSVFLWEGVTLYLSEADVRKTLETIKSNAAAGSAVILDVYGNRMLDMARQGVFAKTLDATGEALNFGLDFSSDPERVLSAFVTSQGFDLGPYYFLGSSHKKGPYMVVATLEI